MNVLAARAAPDTESEREALPPPLTWWATDRPWKGEDGVAFRRHALPGLLKQNLHLYCLPAPARS